MTARRLRAGLPQHLFLFSTTPIRVCGEDDSVVKYTHAFKLNHTHARQTKSHTFITQTLAYTFTFTTTQNHRNNCAYFRDEGVGTRERIEGE